MRYGFNDDRSRFDVDAAIADASSSLRSYVDSAVDDAVETTVSQAVEEAIREIEDITRSLESVYPVGSIYLNATNSANPAQLLGFGTWQRLAQGRMLIDADQDHAAGRTGGSETHDHGGSTGAHTLTTSEIPAHTHGSKSLVGSSSMMSNVGLVTEGARPDGIMSKGTKTSSAYTPDWMNDTSGSWRLKVDATHEHSSVGGNGGHSHDIPSASNMPPWIAVYMWVRTA